MGEATHPSDEHMSHADTLIDSHEPSEASWRAKHGGGGGAQPLFTSSHEVLPALQLRSSAVAPLISASGFSGGAAEFKCYRAGNQNQRKIQRTGKKMPSTLLLVFSNSPNTDNTVYHDIFGQGERTVKKRCTGARLVSLYHHRPAGTQVEVRTRAGAASSRKTQLKWAEMSAGHAQCRPIVTRACTWAQ